MAELVTIPDAVMLDKAIGQVQANLSDIPWLDVVFGRAQRLLKSVNGRTYSTPNVYCGGWRGHGSNDYIEVSPDANIGNFAFFVTDDPVTIEGDAWLTSYSQPFGLIAWCDLRRVFGENENRNTQVLVAQLTDALRGSIKGGAVRLTRQYERAENIYRGFSLQEIDNQFLMHPYWGVRIDGVLSFDIVC